MSLAGCRGPGGVLWLWVLPCTKSSTGLKGKIIQHHPHRALRVMDYEHLPDTERSMMLPGGAREKGRQVGLSPSFLLTYSRQAKKERH